MLAIAAEGCSPLLYEMHLGLSLIMISLLLAVHYFAATHTDLAIFSDISVFKHSKVGSLFHVSGTFLNPEISSAQVFKKKIHFVLFFNLSLSFQMFHECLFNCVTTALYCNALGSARYFLFLFQSRKSEKQNEFLFVKKTTYSP